MKIKKLSIIIPVYNEEKTVAKIIDKVLRVKLQMPKEIIVIDDGSKDRSSDIIKKYAKKNPNIKYFHKQNGGKGSAIRYGFKKSTGDVMVVQDADLEYDPQDYKEMLKVIVKGDVEVVYGSRYLSEKGHFKEHDHMTFKVHKIGNNMLSLLTSLLYGKRLTDMETCYKMFTRNVYKRLVLVSNRFDIEPEITAKIRKSGFDIQEVPINYFSRDFNEGKKITWKDGIAAAWTLVKYRFIN